MTFDCIIVGGGPAGLSAALMLGRCRRRVLLCDVGRQRNLPSKAMHGYPTRDGTEPAEFLRLARAELGRYGTIECREVEIVDATRTPAGFEVSTSDGTRLAARKLLLATGVVDDLPAIDGLAQLYGISVHHCPYCDAWEWRDRPMAVYGDPETAGGLALTLTSWSRDIVVCTGGRDLPTDMAERVAASGIVVRSERVIRLEGREGLLERIMFAGGPSLERSALFVCVGHHQASGLAKRLGCRFTEKGAVNTGKCEATNVPGLYVAGDASKEAQFVVVAAAEGAEAGMAIHKALAEEDLAAQNKSSIPSRASLGVP